MTIPGLLARTWLALVAAAFGGVVGMFAYLICTMPQLWPSVVILVGLMLAGWLTVVSATHLYRERADAKAGREGRP
jgi:hypothetical protein